jgi:hypothetical protein
MQMRLFCPERNEVTVGWRKVHIDKYHNLHYSFNIIWVMKSRRMRWVIYVARREIIEMHTNFENLKARSLGRTSRKREDNIKMDPEEIECEVWTGFIWLDIGTSGGLFSTH